jgi:hypothetical protein
MTGKPLFFIGTSDTQTATFEMRWSFFVFIPNDFHRDQKNREATLEAHNASATAGVLLSILQCCHLGKKVYPSFFPHKIKKSAKFKIFVH